MFGNKKKLEAQLQSQGGTTAWATVLDCDDKWQSSSSGMHGSSRTDHVRLTLRVEPDGEDPWETTFNQAFPGSVPFKGWQCKVIYDPEDHSKIGVVENSIAPPGVSHGAAERSADIRAQAMAAVQSGDIGSFVERIKAQAVAGGFQVQGTPLVISTQTTEPAAAPAQAPVDAADELTKLADLHTQGVLTDDEFAAAKKKIIDAS